MSTKPALLRAEPHATIGTVILRDAGVIVERWAARAKEEQPTASRVHHDVLLDHLPTFVWELGRSLADNYGGDRHRRPADIHGDQRWETGWSVEEVVRDYQLLRIVVVEHLDDTLDRRLSAREALALGLFIDDAIAASVAAFTACQAADAGRPSPNLAPAAAPADHLLEILGVLGHELRNPLAPLGNAIQVLKVCGGDAAAVERVRAMLDRQFKVMTRLVDDLLDLPRLARAKMQLKPAALDLAALARDAVADRRATFEAAGIAVTFDLPADAVWTTGDASRLSQAVGNVLANAVKFTDRGGSVSVRLSLDAERRLAVLSVRDTGIGIEPAVLAKVFDAFVQADQTVERSRGGLGLGLALVKGIVELHGGTVRAASDGAGRGSEFVVELPLIDRPTAEAAAPAAGPATVSRNVLVVEDNRDSAESLKMYLELLGHSVTLAHTGPDGVRTAAGLRPDVVVCDIGLPGMNGHAVCAALKKILPAGRTLFVALSGHAADSSDKDAADGFDMYMLKPVDPTRLAEVISAGRSA